jgi:hypothetical protein
VRIISRKLLTSNGFQKMLKLAPDSPINPSTSSELQLDIKAILARGS